MKELTTPLSLWLQGSWLFVQVLGDSRVVSYWIDTLVLKNWGKYLRYFAASPFPLQGKTNACSRGSKKDFWRRCRGGLRQAKSRFDLAATSHFWRRCRGYLRTSQDIPSTHHKLLSLALHYLPFASRFPLPHFTFDVLFALSFPISSSLSRFLFLVAFLFARVISLLFFMSNSLSAPISPEFEVLHFK